MPSRQSPVTPSKASKRTSTEPELVVKVDDVEYPVRINEISARDASRLRRESGLSVGGVVKAANADPDIDVIAALVCLSRWQNGDDVTFDDVAGDITYDSKFSNGQKETPGPEALAAN